MVSNMQKLLMFVRQVSKQRYSQTVAHPCKHSARVGHHSCLTELSLCRKLSELFSGTGEGQSGTGDTMLEGQSGTGDTMLEDSLGDGSATGKPESETEMESDSALNPDPQRIDPDPPTMDPDPQKIAPDPQRMDALLNYVAGIDNNSLLRNLDSNTAFTLEAERLPVDTSYEACRARDAVLRPFLQGVYWNRRKEFEVLRNLLFRPYIPHWGASYAERYPFVFDYEWLCRFRLGIIFAGDLLFTDGRNHFLVVEVKDLQPSALKLVGSHTKRRTKRRKKVWLQGVRSAMLWHHQNPQVLTTEVVSVTSGGVDDVLTVKYTGVLSRE